jgi:homocysteine S-methyltransferase
MQAGERIVIDGATGTEVERRGVPKLEKAWNGGGALSHPDIIRQIHADYIQAGAEIVISNTFATARHILRGAGVEDQFEFLNRRGVELAREAREQSGKDDVLVAGGISSWSFSEDRPSLAALHQNIQDEAAIMAEAGADLLMLEMMVDIPRFEVTLQAAQASGLPVWAGFSCDLNEDGEVKLWEGDLLKDALAIAKNQAVPLVNIMHTEVKFVEACLDVLAEHWEGLSGVYAHSGDFNEGDWLFDGVMPPQQYAAAAGSWLAGDVNLVGGCCGMGVAHVQALKSSLSRT